MQQPKSNYKSEYVTKLYHDKSLIEKNGGKRSSLPHALVAPQLPD